MERDAWRKTQLSLEDFEAFKRRVKVLVKLRRRTLIRESSVKR
jgi:glutathione S-transferase